MKRRSTCWSTFVYLLSTIRVRRAMTPDLYFLSPILFTFLTFTRIIAWMKAWYIMYQKWVNLFFTVKLQLQIKETSNMLYNNITILILGITWSTESSVWTWGRISFRWGWQSTGTGCPGRLWSLLLWRYSRPAWTRSCATCCRWPCFGRRVGLDDPQRSLPTPTILWFCD